jgi:hypothetical protein
MVMNPDDFTGISGLEQEMARESRKNAITHTRKCFLFMVQFYKVHLRNNPDFSSNPNMIA